MVERRLRRAPFDKLIVESEHVPSSSRLPKWKAVVGIWPPIRGKASRRVAALLLSADLVFVLLHLVYLYLRQIDGEAALDFTDLSITKDEGYAEFFQYLKLFWIVLVLSSASVRLRSPAHGAWAFVFAYILADDSLQLHEKWGRALVHHLTRDPDVALQHHYLGELAILFIFGVVALALVGGAFLISNTRSRHFTLTMLLLMGVLAFFGVVLDVSHSVVLVTVPADIMDKLPIGTLLELVEDGGEMVITSLLCVYIFGTSLVSRSVSLPSGTTQGRHS